MWYLIVLIPDPCCLSYFENHFLVFLSGHFMQVLLYLVQTIYDLIALVPNSVTTIFGFSLIRHEFSLTTVTKLLRQRHGIYAKKCQDMHKVEIIMVSHFFLSLIIDIVLKVIRDSTPIIFIAIYSAITISLCLLAIRFPRRFHM